MLGGSGLLDLQLDVEMDKIKQHATNCAFLLTVILYIALILLCVYLMIFLVYGFFIERSANRFGVVQLIAMEPLLFLCAVLLSAKAYGLVKKEVRIKRENKFDEQSSTYE